MGVRSAMFLGFLRLPHRSRCGLLACAIALLGAACVSARLLETFPCPDCEGSGYSSECFAGPDRPPGARRSCKRCVVSDSAKPYGTDAGDGQVWYKDCTPTEQLQAIDDRIRSYRVYISLTLNKCQHSYIWSCPDGIWHDDWDFTNLRKYVMNPDIIDKLTIDFCIRKCKICRNIRKRLRMITKLLALRDTVTGTDRR